MNVVGCVRIPVDEGLVRTFRDADLRALDTRECLKRRASGTAAVRAMTILSIEEFIGHLVADCATTAPAREYPLANFFIRVITHKCKAERRQPPASPIRQGAPPEA